MTTDEDRDQLVQQRRAMSYRVTAEQASALVEDGVIPSAPRTTTKPCEVHTKHVPASHVNEIHHVWPLGHGGPNVAANRVVVCATGHNNIHALLDEFLTMHGSVPYSVLRNFSFHERAVAKLGYERILRKDL